MIQKVDFTKLDNEGLDSDSNLRGMPPGHSRYRLNCRSGVQGNYFVVENIRGNQKVNYTLPGVYNECIGQVEDIANKAIYYFIYSEDAFGEADEHSILRYNSITNTITKVLQTSTLGFTRETRIDNAKVIGEKLFWLNSQGVPCQINTTKAINHTNSVPAGLTSYGTITPRILDLIKYPPSVSPTIAYGSDTDYDYNNLRGFMYQFAYRYVYDDDEQSVWSPISKVAKPDGDELADGTYIEDQTVNNYIAVTLQTGTNEVKRVEVAVRDSNISDWKTVEIIDRYDSGGNMVISSNTTYDYNFYNDKQGIDIDQFDFARPFDYVPQTAGAMELSNGRLVFGDIIEGFNPVTVNADLTVEEVAHSNVQGATRVNTVSALTYFEINPSTTLYDRYKVKFSVTPVAGTAYEHFVIYERLPSHNTLALVCQYFAAAITAKFQQINISIPNPVTYTTTGIKVTENGTYFTLTSGYTEVAFAYNITEKIPQLKQGAWHRWGVRYKDRGGRYGSVNQVDAVYIPCAVEEHLNDTEDDVFSYRVAWSINHRPPVWATHYDWVYMGNQSISRYLQYMCLDTDITTDADTSTTRIANFNTNITNNNLVVPNSIVSGYVYYKGDRCRFLYRKKDTTSVTKYYFNEYIDVEILGYDDALDEIILPYVDIYKLGISKTADYFGTVGEI